MNFFRDRKLSEAASSLLQFDEDSIRQVVSAERLATPDVWLADSDAYEKNGRVLRDSESPRLLAYSTKDQVLYASDGCNACIRRVPARDLKQFVENKDIRPELLERLVALIETAGNAPG